MERRTWWRTAIAAAGPGWFGMPQRLLVVAAVLALAVVLLPFAS